MFDRAFGAFLFDMDGTLLSSIASVERVWGAWAQSHGLDVPAFLRTIHGVPAADVVRRVGIPGLDPVAEGNRIMAIELDDLDGTAAIAGARAFLESLPRERWAIVTSAQRALALARIDAAGLPMPGVLITAEDVPRGKPAPDPFLIGAERLGVPAADCLVFEDSPAGIAAGEAAGAAVIVVTATHTHPVAASGPAIADYTAIAAAPHPDGGLQLTAVQ